MQASILRLQHDTEALRDFAWRSPTPEDLVGRENDPLAQRTAADTRRVTASTVDVELAEAEAEAIAMEQHLALSPRVTAAMRRIDAQHQMATFVSHRSSQSSAASASQEQPVAASEQHPVALSGEMQQVVQPALHPAPTRSFSSILLQQQATEVARQQIAVQAAVQAAVAAEKAEAATRQQEAVEAAVLAAVTAEQATGAVQQQVAVASAELRPDAAGSNELEQVAAADEQLEALPIAKGLVRIEDRLIAAGEDQRRRREAGGDAGTSGFFAPEKNHRSEAILKGSSRWADCVSEGSGATSVVARLYEEAQRAARESREANRRQNEVLVRQIVNR